MRKGFDGLQGLVAGVLGQDPRSGHLFLFVNRRRDKLKVLYWDGDELDELLPDRWLLSHPQHGWTIDTIRRKERHAKEKNRRQKRRR